MIKITEYELLKATIQSYGLIELISQLNLQLVRTKFKLHAKLIKKLMGTNCLNLKETLFSSFLYFASFSSLDCY